MSAAEAAARSRAEVLWLRPRWDEPGVGALMTTRCGGVSSGAYGAMNVGDAVGDDPAAVAENRKRLRDAIGDAEPVYLRQVHGATVVRIDRPASAMLHADASLTTAPGVACVVQVADCLPVLFAAPGSRGVAAAHAGWRGLAAGVLEASVAALSAAAGCGPGEISAWLGPCIGPCHFEVGADVLDAVLEQPRLGRAETEACFVATRPGAGRADAPVAPRWLADLAGLARLRLAAAGVRQIGGGELCTVSDAASFFSFRRDRVCGRMAAAVWLQRR